MLYDPIEEACVMARQEVHEEFARDNALKAELIERLLDAERYDDVRVVYHDEKRCTELLAEFGIGDVAPSGYTDAR